MEREDLVRLRRAKDQMDREYARPLDVEEVELPSVDLDELPSVDLDPSDLEPSDFELDSPSLDDDELDRPLAEDDDERESVMYQPLPLKTIPTG